MTEFEKELLARIDLLTEENRQLRAELMQLSQKKPTRAQQRKEKAPKGRAARAITEEEYHELIETMRSGGVGFKPSDRNATAFVVQANLGLRIGDVLKLTPNSFIRTSDGWKLAVVEEKTGKVRDFRVENEFMLFMENYWLRNGIGTKDLIFPISVRTAQDYLKKVVDYLDLPGEIGTHSFRKMYATKAYEKNGRDIRLVQQMMLHGSAETTERYIGIKPERLEAAQKSVLDLR